jgi:prepilin-type N-terminal cleavage/methylation domain-containing protein
MKKKGFKELFVRKRAFTLIELIMTIVVVGIIAVPVSLLLFQHMQSTLQSGDVSMALNLGRFEMEKIKNTPYASIVSASFSNYEGYNYNVTRAVTYVQGNDTTPESLKQIRVTVTKSGDAAVLVGLVTYVARNISYGL